MKYLIKRYHQINKDNDVSSFSETIESELDTLDLIKTLKSKTKPDRIEVYKLVAEVF